MRGQGLSSSCWCPKSWKHMTRTNRGLRATHLHWERLTLGAPFQDGLSANREHQLHVSTGQMEFHMLLHRDLRSCVQGLGSIQVHFPADLAGQSPVWRCSERASEVCAPEQRSRDASDAGPAAVLAGIWHHSDGEC